MENKQLIRLNRKSIKDNLVEVEMITIGIKEKMSDDDIDWDEVNARVKCLEQLVGRIAMDAISFSGFEKSDK